LNLFIQLRLEHPAALPHDKLEPEMNQPTAHASLVQAAPLTRRALAKQRTRERLLDAARRLFTEHGYEAATIRDIAAAADLSTGAVFASFTDKADLFNAVIIADYENLFERMNQASPTGAPAQTILLELLSLAYTLHLDQLPLVQAAIGFSWRRDAAAEKRSQAGVKLILTRLGEVLQQGVNCGELSPSLNIRLTSEMIWDSYLGNYRHAIFDGWDLATLRGRLAAQIGVLLAGFRAAA
jgi:AcrR family transcriptional regulator